MSETADFEQPSLSPPKSAAALHGNAYNLFILILTVLSLAIMAAVLLPITAETRRLLLVYDNLICVVFLIDFAMNLRRAPTMRAYFIGDRGWLDLLGSIPTVGVLPYVGLMRLFRLARLARIYKLSRNQNKQGLVAEVLQNRGQYAFVLTSCLAMLVLTICSAVVLQFESRDPNANIRTGGDAIWWAIVTITTVGYGDRYPITTGGRITAAFVMFAGVGIIAALASLLTSVIIPPAPANVAESSTEGRMPEAGSGQETPGKPKEREPQPACLADDGRLAPC